ncbi:hypothetical protein IAD21_06442 (plasmid) [Abditibacteriota bacterium]|nr:hypothetical protein IAD21_06442 [Abditibacteriota bacterium]
MNPPPLTPAPTGFVYINNALNDLRKGSRIYNKDGVLIGTVQSVGEFTSAEGTKQPGIGLLYPHWKQPMFLHEKQIDSIFLLKANP